MPWGRKVAHRPTARPHLLSPPCLAKWHGTVIVCPAKTLPARQGGSMLSRSTDSPGCPLPSPHPPRHPSAWVTCSLERACVEAEMPFFYLESRSSLTRLRRCAREFSVHLCIWVCETRRVCHPGLSLGPRPQSCLLLANFIRSVFSEVGVVSPRGPAQVQLVSVGDLVSIPGLAWLVLVVSRH